MKLEGKEYNINPSIKTVASLMYYGERNLRTIKRRAGVVNGVPTPIIVKEVVEKIIDDGKYIKFFLLDGLYDWITDFSKPAFKLLFYFICYRIVKNEDVVKYDLVHIKEKTGMSYDMVRRAMIELINKEVFFKTVKEDEFWINMLFLFNGNREIKVKTYMDVNA